MIDLNEINAELRAIDKVMSNPDLQWRDYRPALLRLVEIVNLLTAALKVSGRG